MRRALIVIDVQNEYFTGQMPIEYPPLATSLPHILQAMDAAQTLSIPVIVVQHDAAPSAPIFAQGSAMWQLHPEVARRPASLLLHKARASIFADTGLAHWLTQHAIDTLTIVGYMTHNCNASSIFEAAQRGYQVEFLADAAGSLPYRNAAGSASAEEIHRVFSTVIHSNFGAVLSTAAWLAAINAGQATAHDNVYLSYQRTRQHMED